MVVLVFRSTGLEPRNGWAAVVAAGVAAQPQGLVVAALAAMVAFPPQMEQMARQILAPVAEVLAALLEELVPLVFASSDTQFDGEINGSLLNH
jgi:hypothetical protein